jgi:hypothetical protein
MPQEHVKRLILNSKLETPLLLMPALGKRVKCTKVVPVSNGHIVLCS